MKFAFVYCWALFVLAHIPLALREGSLEIAIAARVVVGDRAFGHVTLIKSTFKGSFFVRELEFSFTMALIHCVDLAFISRSIAIGHLLGLHAFRRLLILFHHLCVLILFVFLF